MKLPGTIRKTRRLLAAHVTRSLFESARNPSAAGTGLLSRDPKTALGADDRAGAAYS